MIVRKFDFSFILTVVVVSRVVEHRLLSGSDSGLRALGVARDSLSGLLSGSQNDKNEVNLIMELVSGLATIDYLSSDALCSQCHQ